MRKKIWVTLILVGALLPAGNRMLLSQSSNEPEKKKAPAPPVWSSVAELLEENPLARGETLASQEALVRDIVGSDGQEKTLDGFWADEMFAISERKSPNHFLRLHKELDQFVSLADPEGCKGVLRGTLRRNPAVVVFRWGAGSQGSCSRSVRRQLFARGYNERRVGFKHISWRVLERPPLAE